MSLALYNEVGANLTWYQLNSDYKDPMYQYLANLSTELYMKYKAPLVSNNYQTIDDFIVYFKNQTLQYGTYECSAPGKKAFMDSAISCFIFRIPFFLEQLQIGWIGFIFVLPIMLISIFGGIRESYRWFILYQAFWDAFLCYDFICAKPTLIGWTNVTSFNQQNTCFYREDPSNTQIAPYIIKQGFRVCLRNASFIPVFYLAFSRYICMYFPGFYKRFTKNGHKIFIFILLIHIICMAIFAFAITSIGTIARSAAPITENCFELCPSKNVTQCYQNEPKYFQCNNRVAAYVTGNSRALASLTKYFKYFSYSIPPTMFFLSIICTAFLFYKIASQLQFQLKSNQESFKQTIKISSVVGFQCLTMCAIFFITGIQKYLQIKSQILDSNYIYDELPTWLFLLQ